jgi:hypothetical protein
MLHALPIPESDLYQPGVCNIGPAEIARRRRSGHAALVAAAVLFGILVAIGAPAPARLLVGFAAAGAAVAYLQAYLHFCAAFGARGVFNFGPLGIVQGVVDPAARGADRRRSLQILLASLAIGVVVGVVAALVPLP